MNPTQTQLDPDALNLTKAIRQHESGGNFKARGKSNEYGAYQYIPETWNARSQKYLGRAIPIEQATPAQQNEVTYKWVKDKKDKGYNVGQIASMHNAGEGAPDAYLQGKKGRNSYGVDYDVPAYAQKVAEYYQHYKQAGGGQPALARGQVQAPEVPVPTNVGYDKTSMDINIPKPSKGILGSILGGIGGIAKAATKPVATMLARPVQLAENLLGQTDENKLADVPILSDIYGDFAVPGSVADVKKDVGRGIQTVAFGLAPVAGGAAFGAGSSLEQGNDLFSGKTLLQTALGAGIGKVAQVATPAITKGVGKITPKFVKDAASGVGKAISPITGAADDFMKNTQILPKPLSKAVNAGADVVNNAPTSIWNAIKGQYGGGVSSGVGLNALKAKTERDIQQALGVTGKRSAGVASKTGEKMRHGAETLFDESPKISVKDIDGNLIPYDPSTASLSQHVQALDSAKKGIYKELETHIQGASKNGVTIDTSDAVKNLQSIVDDVGQPVEMQTRAAQLIAKIKQLQTPTQVNTFLEGLNKGLKSTFKGTSESIAHEADVLATQNLNKALDNAVINIADDVPKNVAKIADDYIRGTGNTMKMALTDPDYIASTGFNAGKGNVQGYMGTAVSRVKQNIIDGLPSQTQGQVSSKVMGELKGLDPYTYNSVDDFIDDALKIIKQNNEQLPIRLLKNKYSNLKAIEDNLVMKAQQMARKVSGGMGGGLYDYINPFNLADALEIVTNPVNAVKAGVRATLLNKMRINKDPEQLIKKVFENIGLYKNLEKGIPIPGQGPVNNAVQSIGSGGLIKEIFPTEDSVNNKRR